MNARKIIEQASEVLFRADPFYAKLYLHHNLKEDSKVTQTMATDGKTLYYNAAWVETKSVYEIGDVVLPHEMAHVAMGHMFRIRKDMDPLEANIAADLAVNWLLMNRQHFPSWMLLAGRGDFRSLPGNLSFEEYFKLIHKEQKTPDQPDPQDGEGEKSEDDSESGEKEESEGKEETKSDSQESEEGDPSEQPGQGKPSQPMPSEVSELGEILPAEGDSEQQQQAYTELVSKVVGETIMEGGKLPGFFEEMAQKMFGPKPVDWKAILKDFLHERTKSDRRTWMRPDRRGHHLPTIQPARTTDNHGLKNIVFAYDTSGSMSGEILNKVYGYMLQILEDFKRHEICKDFKLTMIQFDTQIHKIQNFKKGELKKDLDYWRGRGGTDFLPMLQEVAKMNPKPQAILVVTDMMGQGFGVDIGIPTIWCNIWKNNVKATWGKTVYVGE